MVATDLELQKMEVTGQVKRSTQTKHSLIITEALFWSKAMFTDPLEAPSVALNSKAETKHSRSAVQARVPHYTLVAISSCAVKKAL